jgi:hypothetical protein
MKYSEQIAKRVVEAVLPGTQMKPNVEQSHGEYDFELCYPDGATAAVEITASVNPDQKQIAAEIRNKKKGGPVIRSKSCHNSWMIFPMRNARVSRIRKEVDECLSLLERAGIEHFSSADAFNRLLSGGAGYKDLQMCPTDRCVEDVCYDLRIMSGSTIPGDTPPKIFILNPIEGGAVGPTVAIEAGELEARKEDNRKKLGAANSSERHLMVYVDAVLPSFALTEFEPPSELPRLPSEITHIWLIGHSGGGTKDEFVVWRASTEDPWRSRRVVAAQTNATPAL